MPAAILSRRTFLSSTALTALAAAQATSVSADEMAAEVDPDEVFHYEVTRTDAEWHEMLTESEYKILREGGTEEPFSSPYWDSREEGTFFCKGCDLTLYDTQWQEYPDVGFVFFRHCRPNSILTGVDGNPYVGETDIRILSTISAHCRRCGSHMGHILTVKGTTLHCINGASLTFSPTSA